MLLTGCGATAAPTAAPTQDTYPATFKTVEDLRDAFVRAGGECPEWEQSNHIPLAAESGTCSDSNVLSIYTSQKDRDELVDGFKSIALEGSTILVGENWIINDPSVRDLDPALGGVIFSN